MDVDPKSGQRVPPNRQQLPPASLPADGPALHGLRATQGPYSLTIPQNKQTQTLFLENKQNKL